MIDSLLVEAKKILEKYWGYDQFRSLQEPIIQSVLEGRDTVGLLHTGAGKSICYQVPAMVMKGKTIVISPLIALMQDQVLALEERGIMARAIYAGIGYRQVDLILDNFVNGGLKILYVSPERLETDIFIERFKKANVSLIAVDEAHCISQWGNDFRPSYFNITKLRDLKPKVPIIAVTATATDKVTSEIIDKLQLSNSKVFKSSFLRDNLSLSVMMTEEKQEALVNFIQKVNGSGLIYLRSRSKVKKLADDLEKMGISVQYYHGGMNMLARSKVQKKWIDNETRIIICTNAFGMGVDKPDVRFVIHYDVPPSLEEYYQEAGRAGRDGKPSYGVSIINYGDIVKLQHHHTIAFPELPFLSKFYNSLCNYLNIHHGYGDGDTYAISLEEFSNTYKFNIASVYSCLTILEKEGWLFLNEGIKVPSKVMIISDRESITMSVHNDDAKSKLILHLLRKYEGVFIDYCTIDEGKIANELDMKQVEVESLLKRLASEAILHYTPATDKPQITFLLPRPAPKSFGIDKKRYIEREKKAHTKMINVQDYMIGQECRMVTILDYFDEKGFPCGNCDICRGSKLKNFTDKEKEGVYIHLKQVATQGKITCKDYMNLWPFNKKNKAYACLLQLGADQKIKIDDNFMIHILNINA